MFLFQHKFLTTAASDITEDVLTQLITGVVFASLDEKGKKEFRDADFIEILIFINIEKSKMINQYVKNYSKMKKNNLA